MPTRPARKKVPQDAPPEATQAAENEAQAGARKELHPVARRWQRLLAREGYRPSLEVNSEDATLVCLHFKREGLRHQLYVEEGDPTFFHLASVFHLDTAAHPEAALFARANDLNGRYKGVQITLDLEDPSVGFHAEGFSERLPSGEVLERWMGLLRRASRAFFEELEAERPRALA